MAVSSHPGMGGHGVGTPEWVLLAWGWGGVGGGGGYMQPHSP